jgi:N-acetylglucosamine kinase-like BadF-type ATPase
MSLFLGVDGGGTKTALCLVTGDGELVAEAQAGSVYYFSEGIELVGRVLGEGIAAVCEAAGVSAAKIDYAYFGLPSYGEVSSAIPALDAAPRLPLGHDRYTCDNDMICAWAGSLAAADGINVIAGTGSMTYGENAGQGARVGGWGELFGDEGSGYWIAIRGLAAFSKMSDGRLPAGPLHRLLAEHLELTRDLDLVDVVLNRWQGDRGRIAALSTVVAAAADQGDPCALRILDEAGRELAEMVDATRLRLAFGVDRTVQVSYSGGVFNAGAPILDAFRRELAALHEGYELHRPFYPPVVGAALYAAKRNGTPLGEAALARLQSETMSPA